LRIAICEDDQNSQISLSNALTDWAKLKNAQIELFCYSSAEAFLIAWPDMSFDLLFLDIKMKILTGIELANIIRKYDNNIKIVFITSYKQFVFNGYDVNAMHYMIKPISLPKLHAILDNAYMFWHSQNNSYLIVANKEGLLRLLIDDIFYISIYSHIATVYTEKCSHDLRKTVEEFTNLLPWNFIRCHRSYIVNLFKVNRINKSSLSLSNGFSLPISRSKLKLVKDKFIKLHIDKLHIER